MSLIPNVYSFVNITTSASVHIYFQNALASFAFPPILFGKFIIYPHKCGPLPNINTSFLVFVYIFSVWCLFSGFKQHRNVWHIVGSQHTIVVDLYVFVETTIETYTILRKLAFAIGFFYPTDIFFDSSYVLRFTWIYYYHYFTLELPFLRLHAVFKPNVWSLFVIFVVYLFCQKPGRGRVCVCGEWTPTGSIWNE